MDFEVFQSYWFGFLPAIVIFTAHIECTIVVYHLVLAALQLNIYHMEFVVSQSLGGVVFLLSAVVLAQRFLGIYRMESSSCTTAEVKYNYRMFAIFQSLGLVVFYLWQPFSLMGIY